MVYSLAWVERGLEVVQSSVLSTRLLWGSW